MIGTISETAVSTVSETIGKELESFGSVTWIAGGYMLTVVAFSPLFGKLSDIFGRKPAVLFCNLIFGVGCLGCALAVNMPMLIIFRVIAGVGGGGLMALSFIMVADVIPVMERPLYYGIVSMTFAVSNIIGPIIGGFIALHSWRLIFYVLIPICVILSLIVIFILPLPRAKGDILGKLKRVDWFGCLTLILFITGIILVSNWGGKDYAWNSAPIIVTLCLSVVFFFAFGYIEAKLAPEPILPLNMFNRNTISANLANFLVGGVNFVAIFYIPIYYQSVKNYSTTESGYYLIPLLVPISAICMFSASLSFLFRTIRGIMWFGTLVITAAVVLLGLIPEHVVLGQQIGYIIILGVGIGCIKQNVIYCCQLSVTQELMAIATGFTTFSQNIGGVIGLAIAGSVFNNVYTNEIHDRLPEFSPQDLLLTEVLEKLTSEQHEIISHANLIAFRYSFLSLIPFAALGFISLLFLTKLRLPRKEKQSRNANNNQAEEQA
ncbi:MFS general substrate transporter [Conidiobolus coronatus NRRL 28638]|uniref:MFS general substrate transporter n=1 Tax=Conidiobolus coronatus (strain ATCC 28846 / CBS 209.66 / NRRL 28638) TaxID=796925 RepID=A0A137NYD9_CONC2|nr:MFS general substrate transporter [Conidiobolus coronatus NRRL 28638]|eukprot:KXN67880.1 MFS general substrate transporter [Conidiobolus coronatus NRRL 28638]